MPSSAIAIPTRLGTLPIGSSALTPRRQAPHEAEPARTLANQWTGTGAGEGGARPARGDRYGWAGATRDGSVGATVTTTDAAAATTGITTAGEWCVAMQVAQDPAARRSLCVRSLADTATVYNTT